MNGPIGVFRAVQGFYRWHAGNMSTHYYADVLRDQRERLKACSEVVDRWRPGSAESARWLESATRRVSEEAFWLASKAFDKGELSESAACLRFAEEVYPRLRRSGNWRRFRLKSLVGHSQWRRIQRLRNSLRAAKSSDRQTWTGFQRGQLNGWWPGASC